MPNNKPPCPGPIYRVTSSTRTTETLEGTYPPGMTEAELVASLSLGLGGSVKRFDHGQFTYVRNTD